jgi:hypothetical protein
LEQPQPTIRLINRAAAVQGRSGRGQARSGRFQSSAVRAMRFKRPEKIYELGQLRSEYGHRDRLSGRGRSGDLFGDKVSVVVP